MDQQNRSCPTDNIPDENESYIEYEREGLRFNTEHLYRYVCVSTSSLSLSLSLSPSLSLSLSLFLYKMSSFSIPLSWRLCTASVYGNVVLNAGSSD